LRVTQRDCGAVVAEVDEHELAGGAFDQGADRGTVPGADEVVTLPVPDLDTIGNRLWPVVDHRHRHQMPTAASIRALVWTAAAPSGA